MSNASGGDRLVFRDRVSELQDKLKKSEEERMRLEAQFEVMMIAAREEEAARLSMLRGKYEKIVECEKRRRDRNDQILHTLDRIESRTAMIVAKSERLQLLRRHYEAYVASIYPAWNGNAITSGYNGFTVPHIQPAPPPSHHPPRNGARSPTLQKDPLLFPLNPVKGAYISPYPSQKPYDLMPSPLNHILQSPAYEQQNPARPQDLLLSPQYSHQSIPLVNEPLPSLSQRSPNATYQPQSSTPKQNLVYPSLVTPKTSPQLSRSYDNVDKTSNEYRRRNLFPDEPYAYRPNENGVDKYISALGTNDVSRNEANLELNDYMKKTADLLNYTMRDYGKEAASKNQNDDESKLANSADVELEQNTSHDILNASLSDDGVLNEDEMVGKTQSRKGDAPDVAFDTDEGFKPRRVKLFNERQDHNQKVNALGEKDSRGNTSQDYIGQEHRPEEFVGERGGMLENGRIYENHEESPVENMQQGEKVHETFAESPGGNKKYASQPGVGDNDYNGSQGPYDVRESQDVREVDSGIGREDFDGYKPGPLEDQIEDNSESQDSRYHENQIETGQFEEEDNEEDRYGNGSMAPVQDHEHQAKQSNGRGEFDEADESAGYEAESHYAGEQVNAEQTHDTLHQGEYVDQDPAEYQGQEGYVNQDQYGEQQLDDQQQGQYETEHQEGQLPLEGSQYEDTEYQQQYQEHDGQYEVDETQYHPDDQTQYAVDDQGQYAVDDQGHYAVDDQGQYAVDDQGQYAVDDQGQYAVDDQGQYAVDNQGQYAVDDQAQYAVDDQGQYVDGQAIYEEGQPQYGEGQDQYGGMQNQYEDGQHVYAEQQEQYVEDPRQYEGQDQGQYAAEGQGQYSTENQAQYQEGYDEAAYQEYPQEPGQDYVDGTYEVGHEGDPNAGQHWQGERGGEVYFEEGKYHEPTAGYERDEMGGEYVPVGEDGTAEHETMESSQAQAYYDEAQEYSVQEQGGHNEGKSQKFVDEGNRYGNDDTSVSSAVDVEQNMAVNQAASAVATKPRKSGLAMLDSDTESSAHLGNAAASNDDSDFDFSSGK